MTAWLEQIAAELLDTTAELRHLLRAAKYDRTAPQHPQTDAARYSHRTVTLSEKQARALLRGALPAPIAASKLKTGHVQLNHALALLVAQLFALNDPLRRPDHVIAAALSLQAVLESWLAATRWKQATTRAKTSWRFPINTITRHSTDDADERNKNVDALPMFTLAGAAIAHEITHRNSSGAALQHLRRHSAAHLAKQAALDLIEDAGADIVPIRQPEPPTAAPAPPRKVKARG